MRQAVLFFLVSIFLVGCSGNTKQVDKKALKKDTEKNESVSKVRSEREIQMKWRGKPAEELVKKYGNPDSIINTTLLGGPASEGYVYEEHRMAGNPNCVNVYVVTMSDDKILKYFCR